MVPSELVHGLSEFFFIYIFIKIDQFIFVGLQILIPLNDALD